MVVQTADAERRDALDTHLWIYRDDSFLPHGTDAGEFAAEQPILIVAGDGNQNGATVRFLVDGAEPPPLSDYERVVFMFDGYDQQQLESARGQWKRLKGRDTTSPIGSRTATAGGRRRLDPCQAEITLPNPSPQGPTRARGFGARRTVVPPSASEAGANGEIRGEGAAR